MIVDRAIYREGRRVAEPGDLAEMADTCRHGGGMAWIGLVSPTAEEFESVTREFALHELAVEDAINAHQRAKLERYGDTLFCVLRPARYVDETETVEFGEVHVFAGPEFVVTVRHGEKPDLAGVRRSLEARPDLMRRGLDRRPARDHEPRRRRLRARRGRRRRTTSTRSRTRSSGAASAPACRGASTSSPVR